MTSTANTPVTAIEPKRAAARLRPVRSSDLPMGARVNIMPAGSKAANPALERYDFDFGQFLR